MPEQAPCVSEQAASCQGITRMLLGSFASMASVMRMGHGWLAQWLSSHPSALPTPLLFPPLGLRATGLPLRLWLVQTGVHAMAGEFTEYEMNKADLQGFVVFNI